MRWKSSRRSGNIDDRRGSPALRAGGIGGGLGLVALVVVTLLGGNPLELLQLVGGAQESAPARPAQPDGAAPTDEMGAYLSAILAMTEDVWSEIFAESGGEYQEPILVLFTGSVQSACGFNTSATGPFYCPPDQNLYLDTSFFDELARLGGAGDFAQAYVVGHEVGHHVQTLTGTSAWLRSLQEQSSSRAESNQLQVLMELQADCYAGVWANRANRQQQVLEPGDVEEGLAAAAAIGDDRLQREAGRAVSPESFTHGSSGERQRWLDAGLRTGDPAACDTFGEAGLTRSE
ncbi:MAG TPA: neutral zinc metallopeptidase [Longimicrobiales bacterium]|nr:neutral zinc metallopeptidase [Longimicrobiales bacterium]